MAQVFNGQSVLSIQLDTKYSGLADATGTRILYQKPSGKKGYFNATVDGTKLVYNVQPDDIDESGTWQFQSYFEIGPNKAFGTIRTQAFNDNLLIIS